MGIRGNGIRKAVKKTPRWGVFRPWENPIGRRPIITPLRGYTSSVLPLASSLPFERKALTQPYPRYFCLLLPQADPFKKGLCLRL